MAQTEVSAQTVESYSEGLNQITNVNQLRDVSPTDWAYEASRFLVHRFLNGAKRAQMRRKIVYDWRANARAPRCIAMAVFQVFPIKLIMAASPYLAMNLQQV